MDEEDLDALLHSRPFGRDDAMRADARARRASTLAVALWGRNSGDLQRQLLAAHPEIPSAFDLADLRDLQRTVQTIAARLSDPRSTWSLPLAGSSVVIFVAGQRFTEWEARCEIVRRAIEYLERR
jgi:hypothetical protein